MQSWFVKEGVTLSVSQRTSLAPCHAIVHACMHPSFSQATPPLRLDFPTLPPQTFQTAYSQRVGVRKCCLMEEEASESANESRAFNTGSVPV